MGIENVSIYLNYALQFPQNLSVSRGKYEIKDLDKLSEAINELGIIY